MSSDFPDHSFCGASKAGVFIPFDGGLYEAPEVISPRSTKYISSGAHPRGEMPELQVFFLP